MADSSPDIKTAAGTSNKSLPYDKAWYTWSSFFNILTGRASDDETKKYFHMRGLKFEDQDCKRCEERREWLFQYSPVVRFLRENVEKLGGELNKDNVICRRCDTLAAAGPTAGAFSSEWGILLCANHLKNKGHQEDVMAHEMVHAYDHMRFKYDKLNLKHMACTEIRASTLSGECRWVREFFSNPQAKFTGHFQDCVRRRAALSVKMSPLCKNDVEAVKVVNEVWDSCFVDTRPFDEIYR